MNCYKASTNNIIVENFSFEAPKTKEMVKWKIT